MREGWYLMSTREVEQLVSSWRSSDVDAEFGVAISSEQALAFRDAGNIPDEDDRSLRLVLFVDDEPIERKRIRYEPDFHRAPEWRRDGSRPVNVLPLRSGERRGDAAPWWEHPRVKELEAEWRATGGVAGVEVPADYRSFVFKTVIALQDAGEPITPDSIGDSIARWLSPDDATKIRDSLKPFSAN